MNSKKVICILFIIIIIVSLGGCNNSKKIIKIDNGVYNNSGELVGIPKEEKQFPRVNINSNVEVEDISFSNIYIEKISNQDAKLYLNAKNNSQKNILDQIMKISLTNEKGQEIGVIGGKINFLASDSEGIVEIPIFYDVSKFVDNMNIEIEFINNN